MRSETSAMNQNRAKKLELDIKLLVVPILKVPLLILGKALRCHKIWIGLFCLGHLSELITINHSGKALTLGVPCAIGNIRII